LIEPIADRPWPSVDHLPDRGVSTSAGGSSCARHRHGSCGLEADRILKYMLMPLREGDHPLAWETDGAEFRDLTLTAARMAGSDFHMAQHGPSLGCPHAA
jgi:hypothetical protein